MNEYYSGDVGKCPFATAAHEAKKTDFGQIGRDLVKGFSTLFNFALGATVGSVMFGAIGACLFGPFGVALGVIAGIIFGALGKERLNNVLDKNDDCCDRCFYKSLGLE